MPGGSASAWRGEMWYCTQSAGELLYVPETLRHAVLNEEETFGVTVQVDVQVKGGTPLHHTALHGLEEATRLLLDTGAAVSATAANGGTPLHHAAFHGHAGVVAVLLAAGAMVDAKDMRGATPLEVASDAGTRRLLVEAAARGRKGTRKPRARRARKDEV